MQNKQTNAREAHRPRPSKKVIRKVQEEPQAEAAAKSRYQEEEKQGTQINLRIANKQMHDEHKDQLPLPQAR